MLTASTLEHFDRCRRQWQFLNRYEPIRIMPLGAVYQALDYVLRMPTDQYRAEGVRAAYEKVIELAGTKGIHTDRLDPYEMAIHYAHLAEVLAQVLRQPSAEALEYAPVCKRYQYRPTSYLIDGGMRLMRVVLAGNWDDDRQLAELHSWRTMGDVCITGLPMTLRVCLIGASVGGRRHSHWTKAKRHPSTKEIRFRRRQRSPEDWRGHWRMVWREETQVTADQWIERMAADGVLRESAFNVRVKVPEVMQVNRVLDDIKQIAEEMAIARMAIGKNTQFPMTRSSCDDPIHGSCRFQICCYGPLDIMPEETGQFRPREAK